MRSNTFTVVYDDDAVEKGCAHRRLRPLYAVGRRIEVFRKGLAWCPAVVASLDADDSFTVKFPDGSIEVRGSIGCFRVSVLCRNHVS